MTELRSAQDVLKKNGERLIAVIILLAVFIMASRTPLDTDVWWHLRAGEETLRQGHPLLVDIFSYTRYGAAWINHSWLAEVGMVQIYQWGGYLGLAALVGVVASLSMAVISAQMRVPMIFRAFVVVLASLVCAPVWSPRPQVLSLALLAVVGYILYLYKWQRNDQLYWLIPIFVLWSNLHGGYVLGLMLIGVVIAGELLNRLAWMRSEDALPWASLFRLAAWAVASGLAVLVNPNGIQTWLIPFKTVGVGSLQDLIEEWASPDFHQFIQQPFLWLLLGTLAAIGFSRRRMDGTELTVLVVFTALGLIARRNFGPFALVVAPIFARHAWSALGRLRDSLQPEIDRLSSRLKIAPQQAATRVPLGTRLANLVIVATLGFVALMKLYIVTAPELVRPLERQVMPVGAVEWIEANQPPGRLLNDYGWGGYLTWHLRDYPVFVDGRTDLYDDEIIQRWLNVVYLDGDYRDTLERYQVRLLLVNAQAPAASGLVGEGWRAAYQDDHSVVLVREP